MKPILTRFKNALLHRRTRWVLAWFLAIIAGVVRMIASAQMFDNKPLPPDTASTYGGALLSQRADKNNGHTHIDFGGQWLIARVFVLGHGRELYHRRVQWAVAEAGFGIDKQAPVVAYR